MKTIRLLITLACAALALIVSPAHADTFGSGANTFTIDFVNIGNPGNGNDAGAGGGLSYSSNGGVGYTYRMGVTEVPERWILNATNLGLAHVTAGAQGGWIDRPAGYISWYEAAAFVNWLNASTGHHAAYNLTYNLTFGIWEVANWSPEDAWDNDPGVGVELNLIRHKSAFYFIPSEDEWYKAAYHKNDGVTANYWDYATGSNTEPIQVSQGTEAGTAVYGSGIDHPADVENCGGLSPYGTRGQNGNSFEWIESPVGLIRGGSYSFPSNYMRSSTAITGNSTGGDPNLGFRVASVVLPGISGPQIVNLGSPVTFSVVATGINPLSYQWKKDGVEIPGATDISYTIPSVQPWHIGAYTSTIVDATGIQTSGSSLLQVNGVLTEIWRGLIVYYPFDGDALDREAGEANATVSGASLTADRFHQPNRAFDFDGINDQMTATIPNLPVGSASRTISAWAKARPDPLRSVSLVEWGLAQNGQAFGIANSGSPYNWQGKTFGAGNGVNSGVLVDSKWHHVCLTYEGGTLSIYIDGVLKQTKSEAINTGLSALTMGVGVDGSTFYPGSLDEVRIYNRALSPSEVQQLNTYEDPDTDGDGIRDQFETGTGIYVSPEDTGTSPTNPDTDGDGLSDGGEVNTTHSNPNLADTDGDGWDDGFEVSTGFSPTSAASSPDSLSSIRTAAEYRFHAAPGISYRIEASTDLANWSTIETNIIGTGGEITRFYSIEGQPKRYYRSRRN